MPRGKAKDFEVSKETDFLDEKYLNFIEKRNSKQKIKLICIIDRYKYCEYINNITYPNIYELHFDLFIQSNLNELFMFDNLPIKDIYSIFFTYFITIKHYENIKKISFGDEFFLNKNQFISYNDEYYQSIISYLIDEYLLNYIESKENVLNYINIEEIEMKEENLDNIYERYKIIYGFNKMFPYLKNKKWFEIKYKDLLDNKNKININYEFKIFIIDFENKQLNLSLNTIIEQISSFILNIFPNNKNSIEILCFYNFHLDISNDKNNCINSIKFDNFPNLKEFFINNENDMQIINTSKIDMRKFFYNQFSFLYFGYDKNDNLIYYRNGINKIKATDILDLFNLFNKNIVKLRLKFESIDIFLNKDKTELKIVNLLKDDYLKNNAKNSENFYYFPLKNLSDFIYNQNTLIILEIEGFDFAFEEIENKNIKKLNINYYKEEKCEQIFEYKYQIYKNKEKYKSIIDEDLKLDIKFPELKEINISNLKDENYLYNKIKKYSKKIGINIASVKTQNNIKNRDKIYEKEKEEDYEKKGEDEYEEEYYEDEDEDEYEDEEELMGNEYSDLLEKENPVVIGKKIKNKKNKFNNKKAEGEEEAEIILIGVKLNPYKKSEENLFEKDIDKILKKEKILHFKSEIIKNIDYFYLIQQSFLLLYHNIDINKIKFNLLYRNIDINKIIFNLLYRNIDFNYIKHNLLYHSYYNWERIYDFENTKNIFIVLITLKGNTLCLFSENSIPNKKGNDFCLFLDFNEVFYHNKKGEEIRKKK